MTGRPLILLWGVPREEPLAMVRTELERIDAPYVLINQHQVLETLGHLSVDAEVRGHVAAPGLDLALEDVSAAYFRPYDTLAIPSVARHGRDSAEARHALNVDELLWAWAEVTGALVVNRSSAMASNSSKPYQSLLIRQSGFLIPETLVTTDPTAARAFWNEHGDVIYKSVSGIRSIVSRLESRDTDRLADVARCPTQFQRFIPGREHRVHVVGDEVLACEVITEAVDYRYRGEHTVQLRACELPGDVADRCRALASVLGLPVAGIDLRRTPAGEWYCFEVNPSPGYDYYEACAGLPISGAIARLLVSGAPEPVSPAPRLDHPEPALAAV